MFQEIVAALKGAPPCTDYDPELFFSENPEDLKEAIAVCQDCPLRRECYRGARRRREWGVWGGVFLKFGRPVPLTAAGQRAGEVA
jgi:WhiB family redox-sensing transcriptional regulator